MKLKHFSIRDLLWLTLLCAVLVAWWLQNRRWEARQEAERKTAGDHYMKLMDQHN